MASSTAKRLFLFDAMGFIFRAFFAPMDRLQTAQGVPTKVPFLFATMTRRIINNPKLRPDYIAVVFDVAAPTFRDKLFAEYKAQRPPMPDELSIQVPFVRRYCEAMHFPIIEMAGYEADDVIASIARQAAEQNLETYIVSSDKDMMQLVGGPVWMLNPGKGDLLIDAAKVEEIMGVPPGKVPDVMALMGDSIDNIPGARDPNEKPAPGERRKAGIGEVGARQLIQEYGSAEEAVRRAKDVKRANYRDALEKYAEFVFLSKQLATIPTDAPIALDLEAWKLVAPDSGALRALYGELGFSSLLRELAAAQVAAAVAATDAATAAGEPPPPPAESVEKGIYQEFASPAALTKFFADAPGGQPVAAWLELALEKDEDEGYGSRVTAAEFSAAPTTGHSIVFDAEGKTLDAIVPWRNDAKQPKIVHDPKLFDLLTCPENPFKEAKGGFNDAPRLAGVTHSTKLYSYLLRPTTANHDFEEVVLRSLNRTLSGTRGEHADLLLRLAPVLRAEVEKQGLAELYETIDLPLAAVLARMERAGVYVDRKALEVISATLDKELRRLETQICELAGCAFNINSPQQLAEILFDKLNLQPPRRSRGKSRSTAAEVLEELSTLHPLPRMVIEYRELSKLKSTYADALAKLIHHGSGRLHTRFSQTGSATGRLSSSTPNLQNIPVRSEIGRQIRAAFTAAPGHQLLSADYSQIELRLLADVSQDPVLLDAFRRGEDIHSRTAQEVFGVAPFAQTSEHRRAAKVINFGIVYGLSAFGLAQQLGIEQREAAKFIAAYFERYRGVRDYLDRHLAEVRQTGFTRTIFGRIRPMPEINSHIPNIRNFAERTAMNTPLQGAAADLIKLAMIEIDRRLPAEGFQTRMILQVHDELLFEGPQKEIGRLREMVKPVMEEVYKLSVPLIVDVKVGQNWRDMQE
jgi:DNA polymerase-1